MNLTYSTKKKLVCSVKFCSYFFLSNVFPARMIINGVGYNSVEQFYNATRAAMARRPDLKNKIMNLNVEHGRNAEQKKMLKLG